jgi:hypothetical protein
MQESSISEASGYNPVIFKQKFDCPYTRKKRISKIVANKSGGIATFRRKKRLSKKSFTFQTAFYCFKQKT